MPPTEKIVCVHYASRYLPLTENWIHRLLTHYRHYEPVFLCREKLNEQLFPLDEVHSLGDLSRASKIAQLVFFRIAGYIPFFRNVCRRKHAKLLHIHFGYHGAKMTGLKKVLAIPMVCSFYGDDAFASVYRDRYRTLFDEADRILVLGPYMKKTLAGYGCPEDKMIIHHLGIDVQSIRYQPRAVASSHRMRFLIASSFLPKKGVDVAIRALSELAPLFDFSIDVIGDGALKEEINRLIDSGNLRDRVTLHGYKPYQYFIDLAYRCDVFIQASRTTEDNRKEGTPMAIADVMATGMPVIATCHSDIPEMVVDQLTGYLAEENNVESLVTCLRKILERPEEIVRFSANSRKHIEQEFDARVQGERLEAIYDALLKN